MLNFSYSCSYSHLLGGDLGDEDGVFLQVLDTDIMAEFIGETLVEKQQ